MYNLLRHITKKAKGYPDYPYINDGTVVVPIGTMQRPAVNF
jgi:hypothetical protein